jgi:hypothetical protein
MSGKANADLIRRERIFNMAMWEGTKWGIGSFIAGGAGTLYAMNTYKTFNKVMSVSAKTSIPLMCGLFAFSLKYELLASDMTR